MYIKTKYNISLQSDKKILYDTVKEDLEEKIRRLEEDRHNIDISSGKLSVKHNIDISSGKPSVKHNIDISSGKPSVKHNIDISSGKY